MKIKITVTEVLLESDTFDFKLHLVPGKGWSVTRWPAGETAIPPRMELLSDGGWMGVIPASNSGVSHRRFEDKGDIMQIIGAERAA